MTKAFTFAAFFFLCGCAAYGFYDVEPQIVVVEGYQYEVRVKHDRAIAIYRGLEILPDVMEHPRRELKAIEIASGCKPVNPYLDYSSINVRTMLECRTRAKIVKEK